MITNEPIPQTKRKRTWLFKNKDKVKTFVSVGITLTGMAVILAGVLLHAVNPLFALITIPYGIQTALIAMIKHAPKTAEKLKEMVSVILKDEDDATINSFIDNLVSTYSPITQRTMEAPSIQPTPIPTPSDRPIVHNAYYYTSTGEFEISPRPRE